MMYIASYPRSGSTWVRFMLANYFHDGPVNFDNIDFIIPQLETALWASAATMYGISKTHEKYKWWMGKDNVYLIRDPRAVAVSYYRYEQKNGRADENFELWLADWVLNGDKWGRWDENVSSWFGYALFVSYESLLEWPMATLYDIVEQKGIEPDAAKIIHAYENSEIEKMRELEKVASNEMMNKHREIPFVGSGEGRSWVGVLTQDQEEMIIDAFYETMKRFNYVP